MFRLIYEYIILVFNTKKMSHHTLDRFRGAWLGSMLGSLTELPAVAKYASGKYRQSSSDEVPLGYAEHNLSIRPVRKADRHTEIGLEFFIFREQLAKIIIDSQRCNADAIAELLVKEKLQSDRPLNLLAGYSYCLLLLPLIIFYGDNWNLLQKIVRKYLKLSNLLHNSELEADILLWSYLVTLILNSELELNSQYFSRLVRQTLTNREKKTVLTTQLELVIIAMERGVSLHQLSAQLLSEGNSGQSAIALSYYCFITTATDFKLSVQRAGKLDPEITGLTAALTGTLSGAYNGMAGIPLSWKKMANKNTAYSSASQTVLNLFRAWLGIYLAESEPESNLEIQAIAVQGLIQTRKTFKIVSQKSFYSQKDSANLAKILPVDFTG